jgi:hypothetical protein
MGIRTSKLTGSGSILPGTEIGYSYSEDVTSLEPSELSGGAGQVTLQAIAQDETFTGTSHPATKLAINNTMSIIDDDAGEIEFRVQKVSINNELASITGSTINARLNVERTAPPIGNNKTLKNAIDTYCGLVDITPYYSDDLLPYVSGRQVNFIGWQGNVWEHLKMLCAGVSASASAYVPIEMFIERDALNFRIAKSRFIDVTSNASSITTEIDSFDAAQEVQITSYETFYAQNRVITEKESRVDEILGLEKVSINDQLQVEAGETLIKRFTVNASLESVNPPVNVAEITTGFPYSGTTGEYVVVGRDDLPILPSQWAAEGGSLKVSLTENPNEIEITITAPPVDEIAAAAGGVTLAPYKVGTESAGGSATYPALWITGTGVFYEEKVNTFLTGAPTEYAPEVSAPSVINPFITSDSDLYARGVAAAQYNCGPRVSVNIENPADASFGTTIGSMFFYEQNKYRVESVNFSPTGASLSASACASIADFNAKWVGKTFEDFTNFALDPEVSPDNYLSFNEFTIIPLSEVD